MWIRRLSRTLLLGILLVGPGLVLFAQDGRAGSHVFTVRGIRVDATAETAAAAREAAHAEGHVKAMEMLLARLLPRDELSLLRRLEASEILSYVQDFEVADERTSDVRYLASLTFRFKPGPVRELLRANGLRHAETRSKPLVVLPVFGAEGEARLWSEANLWWRAWAKRRRGDWLVPLVVPLGDLGDLAAIDAERALAGDAEAFGAIAQRYGAEDVLITQAVLLGDPESGQASLQVGTARLGRYARQTIIDNHAQTPGQTLQEFLARAADAVDAEVQEGWKQSNLLRPGSQRSIAVTVPVTELADWLEVKRRLRGVAAVRRTEVIALSRSKTDVAITFVGEEQQLVLAMAQSDLNLSLLPGTGWELQLAGAESAAEPAPVTAPAAEPGTVQQPAAETGTAAPALGQPAAE
jgi:hypothetical protein